MNKLLCAVMLFGLIGCSQEPEFVEPTVQPVSTKLTSDQIEKLLTGMEAEYELIETEEQLQAAKIKLAELRKAVAEMSE